MKKKLMYITILTIFLIPNIFTSCRNPWMEDILSDFFKEPIIPVVKIPKGSFMMGSPDGSGGINGSTAEPGRISDEVLHLVTLTKGFYMSKYQVTQEQWQTVMAGNNNNISATPSFFTPANSEPPAGGENQGKRPVENVSWYDALVFCNKLSIKDGLTPVYRIKNSTNPAVWGPVPTTNYDSAWDNVTVNWNANGYRLPTEAEWEYVCRARTTTAYNTGDAMSDNTGWYFYNSDSDSSGMKTHEVGKKPANNWGLYDMHGNVNEWCLDWYDDYTSAPQTNPTGVASGSYRVVRGGAYNNDAQALRSAIRFNGEPWYRFYILGFRVVRTQ